MSVAEGARPPGRFARGEPAVRGPRAIGCPVAQLRPSDRRAEVSQYRPSCRPRRRAGTSARPCARRLRARDKVVAVLFPLRRAVPAPARLGSSRIHRDGLPIGHVAGGQVDAPAQLRCPLTAGPRALPLPSDSAAVDPGTALAAPRGQGPGRLAVPPRTGWAGVPPATGAARRFGIGESTPSPPPSPKPSRA